MDNNLRTVKKDDLKRFVLYVFYNHNIGKNLDIDFKIYSFFIEVSFSLPSNDSFARCCMEDAFRELYARGIITEKPPEKFSCYVTNTKITETFIHPFNAVD